MSPANPPAAAPEPQPSAAPSTSEKTAAASAANSSDEMSPRLLNTTLCVPIVRGSVAVYLGKKAEDHSTHQWTLYLRGPNGEDLSPAVAKVVFQLHPSFPQPVRELTAPPFEVTEQGWGEFEASIRIVWRDPEEKATVLLQPIKLYPPGAPPNATPANISDKPVVHETYDEVVFTDPRESFHRQLMRMSVLPRVQSREPDVQQAVPRYSDEDDWKALAEAQKFLDSELKAVRGRLVQADAELEEIDVALVEVTQVKAEVTAATATTTKASSGSGGSGSKSGTKSKSSGGSSSKRSKTH